MFSGLVWAYPQDELEMDDLLIEWKNDNCWGGGTRSPRKSDFEMCLAGIEKAVPAYAGRLTQSHRVLSGWRAVVGVSHTVPLSQPWVLLFSRWLSLLSCNLQRALHDASTAMWGTVGRLEASCPAGGPLLSSALPFAGRAP